MYNTSVSTITSLFSVTNATFECYFSQEGESSSIYIAYHLSRYGFAIFHNCMFTKDQSMNSLFIYNSKNIHISDSSSHSCNIRADNSDYTMNNCVLQNSIGNSFQTIINFEGNNMLVHCEMLMQYSYVFVGQSSTFIQSSITGQYSTFFFKETTSLAAILLPLQGELYFFNHPIFPSLKIQIQHLLITLLHMEELFTLIPIPHYISSHQQMCHS